MDGVYAERILDASDVCSNCHRVIRVERIDPTRGGVIREYESHYERHEQNTEIGYGPADSVGEQKGVFCDECGTESAHHRIWSAYDVADDRFGELVKQTIATLEKKGVSLSWDDFAAHALHHYDDPDTGVDEALSKATEAAIVAEAASTDDV